ncbi:hypothetical protein C1645_815051 [Glomus cerebriforme]|uniref:Uncharacterized protein n=1 Tax=Glomus cerebriforme TaxID=658196 RepID=A0A397TJQ6_9GLOM|nr:hypothetical protein C1645_815051 [Glomus cerebriforme]
MSFQNNLLNKEPFNCDECGENNIKEIGKDSETTLYAAMWENGPLYFCSYDLRYKVKKYPKFYNDDAIYGISQKPDTKDFIMILYNNFCEEWGEKYTNTYEKCVSNVKLIFKE